MPPRRRSATVQPDVPLLAQDEDYDFDEDEDEEEDDDDEESEDDGDEDQEGWQVTWTGGRPKLDFVRLKSL
jgi:hypothetical protein